MSMTRRFLLASSLARLIQQERGGRQITEGYFPEQSGRSSCVRLDGRTGWLILVDQEPERPLEDVAEIPRAHAEALLAVTTAEVAYFRATLSLGPYEAHVSRILAPSPLDLVDVTFPSEQEARVFTIPAWFGPEVSADLRYRNQSLATGGSVAAADLPLTDEALHRVLDCLEIRMALPRPQRSQATGASTAG